MNLGLPEIMVIAVVALLVLGPERLPDAARKVGKVIGDLKRLQDAVKTEFDSAMVDLERNRPPSYDDPQTPPEDALDDHAPPPTPPSAFNPPPAPESAAEGESAAVPETPAVPEPPAAPEPLTEPDVDPDEPRP